GFDPVALLGPGGCVAPDCEAGELAPGVRAALQIEGPAGSGRFEALGLAIAGAPPRFVCTTGSTVGWRHLASVATQLAPLSWLDDLDGDGAAEVIVWDRLPWGSSEADNGLVPTAYALDGDRLVRRNDRAASAAARVAAAYRALAGSPLSDRGELVACYDALARALDGWGTRP
ncbi:MAG: hypothetical protein KC464_13380, partial [Myxococcales bacterium]|nr:hypothetical protein [Myxococcales bacterium]